MFHAAEKYRLTLKNIRFYGWPISEATDEHDGANGSFLIPESRDRRRLFVIISDTAGWEHASIHAWSERKGKSIPTWDEMCFVKSLFWDGEDCVVQYHPPESEYVRAAPYVLHLWRCSDGREMPMPPYWMIGPKPGQTWQEVHRIADEEMDKLEGVA